MGASQPVEFEVHGMRCSGCSSSVEEGVKTLPGVTSCTVDLAKGMARVLYDAAMVTPKRIAQRIDKSG